MMKIYPVELVNACDRFHPSNGLCSEHLLTVSSSISDLNLSAAYSETYGIFC